MFLAHLWLSTYHTAKGPALAAVVWDASENLRDREGTGLDSMMDTSRVLIGAFSHEIRNLSAAAARTHEALLATGLAASQEYQTMGAILAGLERLATSGLQLAATRTAAVADLGTVLDETRIVIEPSIREAGGEVTWRVDGDLPLVRADHHSLLQVFLNLARNSERAMEDAAEKRLDVAVSMERDWWWYGCATPVPALPIPADCSARSTPGRTPPGSDCMCRAQLCARTAATCATSRRRAARVL